MAAGAFVGIDPAAVGRVAAVMADAAGEVSRLRSATARTLTEAGCASSAPTFMVAVEAWLLEQHRDLLRRARAAAGDWDAVVGLYGWAALCSPLLPSPYVLGAADRWIRRHRHPLTLAGAGTRFANLPGDARAMTDRWALRAAWRQMDKASFDVVGRSLGWHEAYLDWMDRYPTPARFDQALSAIPELGDHRRVLHELGELTDGFSTGAKVLKIAGVVAEPVGVWMDVDTLLDDGTSGWDKGFAAAGLSSSVIGAAVLLTPVAAPLAAVGLALGALAAGYSLGKLAWEHREEIADALDEVGEYVVDQAQAVTENLVEAGELVWEGTQTVASATVDLGEEAWESVSEKVDDAGAWAERTATDMARSSAEAASKVTGTLDDAVDDIGGGIRRVTSFFDLAGGGRD